MRATCLSRYFNPRTREGCDGLRDRGPYRDYDFNPRTREGATVEKRSPRRFIRISIHAPVKGATGSLFIRSGTERFSIHAPVKGATPFASFSRFSWIFQIHAPVKGATVRRDLRRIDLLISIHAPVKGATFDIRGSPT